MPRFLRALAHPLVRYGVGALVLFYGGALILGLMPPLVRLAGPPPDLWFLGYGPARLAGYLEALGAGGRALYRVFLLADLGFAALYGPALAGWLAWLYPRPGPAGWALTAALLDLGEDLLLLADLSAPRPALAVLAGYLTFFKWATLAYAVFALAVGLWTRRR